MSNNQSRVNAKPLVKARIAIVEQYSNVVSLDWVV